MARQTSSESVSRQEVNREEIAAIKQDLRQLRTDLLNLLESVRNEGKSRAGEMNMRLRQTGRDVKDRAGEMFQNAYSTTRDRLDDAAYRARKSIGRRPLAMIGGAFAGGFILGKLTKRNRKK